jgi:hypothetical protein
VKVLLFGRYKSTNDTFMRKIEKNFLQPPATITDLKFAQGVVGGF